MFRVSFVVLYVCEMGNDHDDLKLPALSKATYQRWSFEVKSCARSLGVLTVMEGSEERPSGQGKDKEAKDWDKRRKGESYINM